MRYVLRKCILGRVPEVEITEDEYVGLETARNVLSGALAIEEKYEILIANYLDFEKEMLGLTAEDMIRSGIDYPDMFEVRLRLNTRLVNLLTAARLYVDQLNQDVRECVPCDNDAKGQVERAFSKEYDGNRDYRFMEALRNHAQHSGLPIHCVSQGCTWTSLDDSGLLEFSMEVASQRSRLGENPKFKKGVLDELDEEIDLRIATRKYLESMSNVQESVRSMVAQPVAAARERIEGAQRRYAEVSDGDLVGLCACKWFDDRQVSAVPLLLEWDNVRTKLQARNGTLVNLSRRCVSNVSSTHKK
jgi:hypothetical protein